MLLGLHFINIMKTALHINGDVLSKRSLRAAARWSQIRTGHINQVQMQEAAACTRAARWEVSSWLLLFLFFFFFSSFLK